MLKHTLRIATLVALPLLMLSCSSPANNPNGGSGTGRGGGGRGAAGAAVPVVTARAERKAVPVTIPAVGTVEAMASVDIRAQVTGQLKAIHFEEGGEVQLGQPLFSLDPRPFQVALQQAEAVLARDTATLQNAQAAQARGDALFQRGLIAREQNDAQRATAAALAATVEADKAAIETTRLNLQYTEIAAPITGRTGSLGSHVGDLIRANDTTPLVIINQLTPVYVTFAVPGRFLSDIQHYQARKPLSVTATAPAAAPEVGAGPEANVGTARGSVAFIDNAVDVTTGTIRLKATFPNSDHQLWPGEFVRVTLNLTTQPDAVVVPATAVQASQEGQYVFVVKPDRTVEMRTVKVERQQGDEMIIAEGVTPGDEVVTDGQLRLTPGARVTERGEAGGRSAAPAGPVR
jgi:multidrug efflux system membrane fusion protein